MLSIKDQWEEYVTYGTAHKRQCMNKGKFHVKRQTDGDRKRVCGTHKNQLMRMGWNWLIQDSKGVRL